MQIKMYGNATDDAYQSGSGTHTLTREGHLMRWVYRIDGSFIDSNKYRNDIADRYELDLCRDVAANSQHV